MMVWFFRDFLDGPIYVIYAVILVILIMAIIGFIMERKKFEEEEKNRLAVLNSEEYNPLTQTPTEEVNTNIKVNEEPTIVVEPAIELSTETIESVEPSIIVEQTPEPSIIVNETVANDVTKAPTIEVENVKEETSATPGVLDLNEVEEKMNNENGQ